MAKRRFSFSPEMTTELLEYLKQYKTEQDFDNVDFNTRGFAAEITCTFHPFLRQIQNQRLLLLICVTFCVSVQTVMQVRTKLSFTL